MSNGKDARDRAGAAVSGGPSEVGCARIGVAGWRRPAVRVLPRAWTRPKYFSIWKGRLLRAGVAHSNLAPSQPAAPLPALVPVMVKPARMDESVGRSEPIRDAEFGLGVTLPNGIALNFRLPSVRALPPLLAELSRPSC